MEEKGYKDLLHSSDRFASRDYDNTIPFSKNQINIINKYVRCDNVSRFYKKGGIVIFVNQFTFTVYQFPDEWFYVSSMHTDEFYPGSKKGIWLCDQFNGLIELIEDLKLNKIF